MALTPVAYPMYRYEDSSMAYPPMNARQSLLETPESFDYVAPRVFAVENYPTMMNGGNWNFLSVQSIDRIRHAAGTRPDMDAGFFPSSTHVTIGETRPNTFSHCFAPAAAFPTTFPQATSSSIEQAAPQMDQTGIRLMTSNEGVVQQEQPQEDPKGMEEDTKLEKPKRCLTAYNIFFQAERKNLLKDLPAPTLTGKKPRKTHGKIGFAEMARSISAKWNGISDQEKEEFTLLAAVDKKRYDKEMAVWKREQCRQALQSMKSKRFSAPYIQAVSCEPDIFQQGQHGGTATSKGLQASHVFLWQKAPHRNHHTPPARF